MVRLVVLLPLLLGGRRVVALACLRRVAELWQIPSEVALVRPQGKRPRPDVWRQRRLRRRRRSTTTQCASHVWRRRDAHGRWDEHGCGRCSYGWQEAREESEAPAQEELRQPEIGNSLDYEDERPIRINTQREGRLITITFDVSLQLGKQLITYESTFL